MGDLGYLGAHALSMDGKGRIAIPARLRDKLLAEGPQLTLTKHPDGCVLVIPPKALGSFLEQVTALTMDARAWRRTLLGFASQVEMDGAGRVLVDPVLRDFAGLAHETLLIGQGGYFELWDKARYDHYEKTETGGGKSLPEGMKGFAF